MFELSEPWWTFPLRALIVYVGFMLLVRLSGKRTVGEFTPFDLLVVILVGESAQGGLTGGDESALGSLLVAGTLVGLNFLCGFLSARSEFFANLSEGKAVILVRNGEVRTKALRKNNIAESDLDEAIRRAGFSAASEVRLAMLETDGEITVVPRRNNTGLAERSRGQG